MAQKDKFVLRHCLLKKIATSMLLDLSKNIKLKYAAFALSAFAFGFFIAFFALCYLLNRFFLQRLSFFSFSRFC